MDALKPQGGKQYLDCTIGGGGHAEAILAKSGPDGRLFGCDRDGEAIRIAQERLGGFSGRFELKNIAFSEVGGWLPPRSIDAALLDLGVSSMQLDNGDRGFSFQSDGPLDMRMDQRQSTTAESLLAELSAGELAKVFWEYGGERESRRIAARIVEYRRNIPFKSTKQLADFVVKAKQNHNRRTHDATQVFMALRIAVNDETGNVNKGLEAVWQTLKPGGLIAVISFHSLEDRIVKEFGRIKARPYTFSGPVDVPLLRQPRTPEGLILTRKAILPRPEEVEVNPRSRSAQLRIFQKSHDSQS